VVPVLILVVLQRVCDQLYYLPMALEGIGTTEEIFQLEGRRQHLMEELNNFGAIASAVAFSM